MAAMRAFSFKRELRFGDCDPSGIAYYPSYLNILNGVVEEFWTLIGFPWVDLMIERGVATPTVHIECDFARPSSFGNRLTFSLGVRHVGRTSLRLEHVVSGADGLVVDAIRWRARQVLVATSMKTRRSLPWPEDVRDALLSHVSLADLVPNRQSVGQKEFAPQSRSGHVANGSLDVAASEVM